MTQEQERALEIKGMTPNELRREKVRLDRLMDEKRILIQTTSDELANLRRDKKRVIEQIYNLGEASGNGILAGNKQ